MTSILKILVIFSSMLLFGCLTLEERAIKKTPEDVQKWSDEYLCQNAGWKNPAIKVELQKRKLVSEGEYNSLYVDREIRYFPRVGMPKCAMWTYARTSDLITITTLPNGTIQEIWEITKGERFFFFFGGFKYQLTFNNNFLSNVSEVMQ